jgi:HK97 gp10 family phage protein
MHSASSHVAADLAQSARGRAPRRSGRLRASIAAQTPAPNTARVVAVAPYGIHVEHGTRFMRAQPFLTPTLEARKGATVAAYRADVIKALNGIKGA